jgi:hypothetical protein
MTTGTYSSSEECRALAIGSLFALMREIPEDGKLTRLICGARSSN